MTVDFRVVDLRENPTQPETVVKGAATPELAAQRALGIDVARSGSKGRLVARVYWQAPDQPTSMVRMYARAEMS